MRLPCLLVSNRLDTKPPYRACLGLGRLVFAAADILCIVASPLSALDLPQGVHGDIYLLLAVVEAERDTQSAGHTAPVAVAYLGFELLHMLGRHVEEVHQVRVGAEAARSRADSELVAEHSGS